MRLLRGPFFLVACIVAVALGVAAGAGWFQRAWRTVEPSLPAPVTEAPPKNRYQLVAELGNGPDGFDVLSRDVLRLLTQAGFCGGAPCAWTEIRSNSPDDGKYAPGEFIAVKLADMGDKRLPKVHFRVEHPETSSARWFSLVFKINTEDPILVTKEAFLHQLALRFDFDPKAVLETCRRPSTEPIYSRGKDKRFLCFLRPATYFEGGKIFEKERYFMFFDSAARCGRRTVIGCAGTKPEPR